MPHRLLIDEDIPQLACESLDGWEDQDIWAKKSTSSQPSQLDLLKEVTEYGHVSRIVIF